jgi:hypothetical protein
MSPVFKKVCLAVACWNLIGFVVGIGVTWDERSGEHDWHNGGQINVHTGCIYHSASSFTNLGYVTACELFRKRFDYEGIDKAFKP